MAPLSWWTRVWKRHSLPTYSEHLCKWRRENKNQITASFTNLLFPRNEKHLQQSFWLGSTVIATTTAIRYWKEVCASKDNNLICVVLSSSWMSVKLTKIFIQKKLHLCRIFLFFLGDSYTVWRAVISLFMPDDYAYMCSQRRPLFEENSY